MNKKRLLKLADHVETLQHVSTAIDDMPVENGFNMERVYFKCGSPACLAGWANHLWGKRRTNSLRDAEKILDLTVEQADDLFLPEGSVRDFQPEEAALVIRQFVETGEVGWEIVQ